MADQIGAGAAMADPANGNLHPGAGGGAAVNAAFAQFLVDGLTPAMRAALAVRQQDMFGRDLLASGWPITIKALQRRGLIEGRECRVTELGEIVIREGKIGEGADA